MLLDYGVGGEGVSAEYHCMDSCNKFGSENEIEVVDTISFHISEAKTSCKSCGHKDYWAYGFFESGQDMVSNCRKYSNKAKGDN